MLALALTAAAVVAVGWVALAPSRAHREARARTDAHRRALHALAGEPGARLSDALAVHRMPTAAECDDACRRARRDDPRT